MTLATVSLFFGLRFNPVECRLGLAFVDSLTAKALPVEAVSFSMQGKVEFHSRLKSAFEGGRITIPRHPDLLRELSSFEYKISEAGNLLLHGGHRDDLVDSLAMAVRNLTAAAFKPGIIPIPSPLYGRPAAAPCLSPVNTILFGTFMHRGTC